MTGGQTDGNAVDMQAGDKKGERSGRAYIIRAEVNAGREEWYLHTCMDIDMYVCKYICTCTHCVHTYVSLH